MSEKANNHNGLEAKIKTAINAVNPRKNHDYQTQNLVGFARAGSTPAPGTTIKTRGYAIPRSPFFLTHMPLVWHLCGKRT